MPRQVRIRFAGAVYHCMARGDRREPIVRNDADRDAFVELLEELVERTGFEFFAWVLMAAEHLDQAVQCAAPVMGARLWRPL
jgi:hypothetical protein